MSIQNAALKSFVQRIETLEEEKREIQAQIASVKQEAKSAGFDSKILTAIIKERRLSAADRREFLELMDVYRAALGMLDGTPLGDFARRRMMGEDEQEQEAAEPTQQMDIEDAEAGGQQDTAEPTPAEPPVDLDAAREQGAEAARTGAKIVANPYGFQDPRRAAWDEGFCSAIGNDGMEIPDAWRRKAKPKGEKGSGE